MADKSSKTVTILDRQVKFIYPSIGKSSEADLEYSKAFTQAIQAGLKPQILMEKTLRDLGVWTEVDDKELKDKNEALQDSVRKIMVATSIEEREKEKIEFYQIQSELLKITVKRYSLNNHTAEQKGEEAKTEFLCWNCILNEDNSPIWKTQEIFRNEQNNDFMKAVVRDFLSFASGAEERMNSIDSILSGDIINTVKVEVEVPEVEKQGETSTSSEKIADAVAS